jgi:REP element-mobilizing transposase RayT
MPIFEGDHDRMLFLAILQEVVKRFNWLCHAYCLMGNHYHLLVQTVDGNLSRGMRHLNGVYTQSFNRQHSRVGHVFQGRYKAILVERDSYLLQLCRYVVLNPVGAGMVEEPGQYLWSSYGGTAGLGKRHPLLTVDWILGQFGDKLKEARKQYSQFVLAGIEAPSPWVKLKAQCLLGGREFIEKIAPALKDKSGLTEIPKQQRLVGRPALDDVLSESTGRNRQERDKAIIMAHLEYGYTLSEIAKHIGLHYTTISKIVRRNSPAN